MSMKTNWFEDLKYLRHVSDDCVSPLCDINHDRPAPRRGVPYTVGSCSYKALTHCEDRGVSKHDVPGFVPPRCVVRYDSRLRGRVGACFSLKIDRRYLLGPLIILIEPGCRSGQNLGLKAKSACWPSGQTAVEQRFSQFGVRTIRQVGWLAPT
jgi:hypothetical protein